MADPILARALAPKVTIGETEYELYITPRDVLTLANTYQVDVLTREVLTGAQGFERAALIIAVATHDEAVTKDTILDSLNVGQIVQFGKQVMENAAAGIVAKTAQPTA